MFTLMREPMNMITRFYPYIVRIFDLAKELRDHDDVYASIKKGVEFRGINVWTLIFAIFIASIGLNVNSTAVIIGAMLISPLMGPIMGLGLSVAIYDFELLKKSLRNLFTAVIISILTSTIYFALSPLSEAQSELLARTTPTLYDVLIAFFGGLAGILASTTKEKGNVLPGVAIATALMPPLCTAGFGIASGNIWYFLGALYLFFINAVMISFSTLIFLRLLQFPIHQNIDVIQAKRVKSYIYAVVLVTVIPSIYFAYHIVNETIFKSRAMSFIEREMNEHDMQVLRSSFTYKQLDSNRIDIMMSGKYLDEQSLQSITNKLDAYSLNNVVLTIRQSSQSDPINYSQLRTGLVEDLFKKSDRIIENKDSQIVFLRKQLQQSSLYQYPIANLAKEAHAIDSRIESFSAQTIVEYNVNTLKFDTSVIAIVKSNGSMNLNNSATIKKWLTERLNNPQVTLYFTQ